MDDPNVVGAGFGPTVQLDDEGTMVRVATASDEELEQAIDFNEAEAHHLRNGAAMRGRHDAIWNEWKVESRQREAVATRLRNELAKRRSR